jgi:hypothetical protein
MGSKCPRRLQTPNLASHVFHLDMNTPISLELHDSTVRTLLKELLHSQTLTLTYDFHLPRHLVP